MLSFLIDVLHMRTRIEGMYIDDERHRQDVGGHDTYPYTSASSSSLSTSPAVAE
jgi:hypothetical protein